MKLIDSLSILKDGKKLISPDGMVIELIHGEKFFPYFNICRPLSICNKLNGRPLEFIFTDNQEWEIYEEPSKEFILEVTLKNNSSEILGGGNFKLPAKNAEEAFQWLMALNTFVELKNHPLSIKPLSNWLHTAIYRYIDNHMRETIEKYSIMADAKSNLFPCNVFIFPNEAAADQVIAQIGENRLLQMFKTFQGIYE